MYGSSILFNNRLFLAGFPPQLHLELKQKIASEGGVVSQDYDPGCNIVVVHNIPFEDPICVTAIRDGKPVVSGLWLNHTFEAGVPVDTANILYRPMKDLNGIPGASELIISLTGYQGVERGDIKTKVGLMGAVFSKAMVGHSTTHLICYKFEGEKYDMAKRTGYTKVVNHQWVDDCLKAWEILPEEPYSHKSGLDLEMMADVAEDSEDENEDITGSSSRITNLQNETGEAHNHSLIARHVLVPSSSLDRKLLQSDFPAESVSVNKLGKQPAQGHPSNQIGIGHPSTSGNPMHSEDFDAENFNNIEHSKKTPKKTSSPLNVDFNLGKPIEGRKTPHSRASLQTARKLSKSYGTPEEKLTEKRIEDVLAFNLQTDTEEDALGCLGVSSSRRLDSDAGNCMPLTSRLSPRKSNITLQSAGELSNLDGKFDKTFDEEVIAGVCTSFIGTDQGTAASTFGASGAESGLLDEIRPGGLLPQKRNADGSNVFHITPKSQKLNTSANKRVDAAEPKTAVNNVALNSGIQSGDEFPMPSAGRSSPDSSSSKHKVNSVAPSRSLAFDMLQGSEPMNTDAPTSLNTYCVSTSLVVGNKNGQAEVLQKVGDTSPGTSNVESVKFGNPKLSSADQIDDYGSMPPRKKMVARKTLGSRPKVSKRSADAKKSITSKDSFQDDAAKHSAGQKNKEHPAASLAAEIVLVPPTVEEPVGLGSKPCLKFGIESNDYAELLIDEFEAPPELNVGNDPLTAKQLHFVKSRTREASGTLLHQADGQGMPEAEAVGTKEKLALQKKGAKKKTLLDVREATKDIDEAEGGNGGDRLKEQVAGAPAKKKCSNLLLKKSNRPVEVENKSAFVCSDRVEVGRDASKVVKRSGKLVLKKGRESILLNKLEGPMEVENESTFDGDEGKKYSKNCLGEQAAPFNMTQDTVEIKNKNGPVVCNGQGTSMVEKHPRKNRDGTLRLKKSDCSDEAEEKNELVLDGEQNPGKRGSASGISDGSMEVEKENDPILVNNQDARKGVKQTGKLAGRKRRGTLVLNRSDVLVNEENKDKLVLDDDESRKGGTLTEKLTNKSDLTVADSDAASKDGKRAGKVAGKKRHGNLVLNKSEVEVSEGNRNMPVRDGDEDTSIGRILTEELTSKTNLTVNESEAANSKSHARELKVVKKQPAYFILCGHRLQRKEFQQLIKRLKGKLCRDSHQWSYQASHFVVPDPIRRTEKFFAAAASGSWILKTDYLAASSEAGKFLPEEPYEWHKNGLSEDGAISFEAPRKWRLLRERTGHGAFYGMRIVIYGECIAPPLDTLKRVVKAGDGIILATSPPYTRALESGVDFAIVSPGMPRVDIWVQEFLRHQIPCVLADYLVEYVCKPGFPLDRHVQYNTQEWAAKSFSKLLRLSEEVVADAAKPPDDQVSDDLACQVCGSTGRGEVMLICGIESGSTGCGIGTHIDCCDPPLEEIPEEDWFCTKCTAS